MTPARKAITISILSLALAIIVIDTTLLNVSLSAIITDLHTDLQSIQWVITAYSLTMAALTITGGRFGDLFGRKRMFVVGAIIFAIGSFLASVSVNVPMMIVGESLIEGIGAALMMPATASLLVANFQGRDRALAFGIWGGIAGAAAAIGPILGGYMATHYSWRWGFRINVVVAAILCLGSLLIPESKERDRKTTLDWVGVILSSLGLLALVFGCIESTQYGWWFAKQPFLIGATTISLIPGMSIVPFSFLLSLLLLSLFVYWETQCDDATHTPLVSLHLFANRQYTAGVITTMVLSLGQAGIIFTLPVFLQAVRGYDALQTGMSLLPMSVALLIISPLGALFSQKIRPKYLIVAGLLINLVAMVLLRMSISIETTSWQLAPGLFLYGTGMGLVMSQINNITLSAVSVEEAGEASGVNNTLRQVGQSLGAAIIGAVLLGALATNLQQGIGASPTIPNQVKPQLEAAIAKQSSNVEFSQGSSAFPPALKSALVPLIHQATVAANKTALGYGIVFALLGVFTSLLLPDITISRAPKPPAAGH